MSTKISAGKPQRITEARQSRYWVPILGHAFRLLETFHSGAVDFSLQEICLRVKISKSSAFRILFTLESMGYASKNKATHRYRLGPKLQELARSARAGRSVVQVARPYMKELHDRFHETVNFVAFQNNDIYYVDIIESSHPFRMTAQVGWRMSFHAAAAGKAIAAFLQRPQLNDLLKRNRMPRMTHKTITNRTKFFKELAAIREQGHSFDDEEVELGACCVAVPLHIDGHVAHAISVSGPTHRMHVLRPAIIKELKRVALAIEEDLAV